MENYNFAIILIIFATLFTSCKFKSDNNDFDKIHLDMEKREKQTLEEAFNIKEIGDFSDDVCYFFVKNQDYNSDKAFKSFNEYQKTLACILELEGEINNGGLDQYYFNPAGNYAKFCEKALENIGSKELLSILQKANSFFPNATPDTDRDKRWKQMEQWDEAINKALDALDQKYYEGLNENISQLIYNYAHKYKKELFQKIKK